MPDNWGFVAAAYAVGVLVLGGYWRHLVRRERELSASRADRPARRVPLPAPTEGQLR